jgi:hypothetical protein
MNPFQPFYNMKIGVVDLSTSSTEVISLDQDRVLKHLGGAAMNCDIFNYNQGDPLIFGTGPLTGSFVPASSLMIATFLSARFDRLCHVPFMLRSGPDMKFSGIDFLVVKGTAAEQSILHVNNGKIKMLPAGNLQDIPIPETIRELKKVSSSYQSFILTGPAADRGVPYASTSIGSKGSLDKAGFAARMSAKKLKGIMFGGTDGLTFNRDNPDQGKELEKRISEDKNFKHKGFLSILKNLEDGMGAGRALTVSRKKDMACYNCPSPCMTHVTFSWQDPRKEEIQKIQDGLLLLDHMGFAALARKVGKNILPVLKSCLDYGLDPAGVASILSEGETLLECLSTIDKIISANSTRATCIPGTYDLFGGGIPPILTGDLWNKRVGLAMILGVCPIFLLRFPQITDTDLLAFLSTNEDVLKTMREGLSSVIESLFTV